MGGQDAEDGLDQLLSNMNSQCAQTLSRLHVWIDRKSHELKARHEQRQREARQETLHERREQEAEARRLEAQRAALHQWETANRARLNEGFEYTLEQSVLSGRAGELDDRSLLRAWIVGEQLEGADPGWAAKLERAQRVMRDEWTRRHGEGDIAAVACQHTNRAVITYATHGADLDATLDALRKGGIPVRLQRADDPQGFLADHPAGFRVQTRWGGQWYGWDEARIHDAVMRAANEDIDSDGVDDAIAYLKDLDLDESAPADRTAAGIEPAETSEIERGELRDAAPGGATETTTADFEQDAADMDARGMFDMTQTQTGGDDVFGMWSVVDESDMAASSDEPGPAPVLDPRGFERRAAEAAAI